MLCAKPVINKAELDRSPVGNGCLLALFSLDDCSIIPAIYLQLYISYVFKTMSIECCVFIEYILLHPFIKYMQDKKDKYACPQSQMSGSNP